MKELTESDYRRIILRRDPHYDGRLYFGVKTTKIYCRPVCPARPKFENIVVYKSQTEAEMAGCRPCLRCRPDLAPGNRFIEPGKNLAASGLRLIEESGENDICSDAIALKLGISARHLRRVFDEQLGASPMDIIQSRRLHLAKQFVLDTNSNITDIAFASGFNSVRRFNESFKKCYRTTPSQLRKSKGKNLSTGDSITLQILIRKPYDFGSVLAYLQRHAAGEIEQVKENKYIRYIPVDKTYATVEISLNRKKDALTVNLHRLPLKQIQEVLHSIRRLFDVDLNPAHLPVICSKTHPGLRVPASYNPFETAIAIILSQLVSVKQATDKLSQLIQMFGTLIDTEKDIYSFPTAAILQGAAVEEIGLTRTKATAIRSLATMVEEKALYFSYSADLFTTRKQLLSIKGIGPWTTEMIMMRCFGAADACPTSDLIVKRALDQNLVDEKPWKTNKSYMTHFIWNEFAEALSKKR